MVDNKAAGGCAGCCVLSTIAVIIVAVTSFKQLDQLDYGLDMDMVSATISSEVYTEPGLIFLGPGHRFVTYPRTVQTMSVICKASTCSQYIDAQTGQASDRLQTRTSDGLSVSLAVTVQYRYDPTRLHDLYMRFAGEEFAIFEQTATALLSQVATNYTAYTFFNDLPSIQTSMKIELTRKFDTELSAMVEALQITDVSLPDAFQNAIMTSIEAQQNITQMQRYKDNMLVTFASEVLVANQTRYQTIARAEGDANRIREEADAAVTITKETVTAEMYSYGNLSQTVGLDADGGLSYIFWDTQMVGANTGKEYLSGLNPATYIKASV